VPAILHEAIAAAEAEHAEAQAWTLTWLESRPRLQLDDLVLLSVDAHGGVHAAALSDGAATNEEDIEDEDDDSWLD
jgi:hypothetical protein